VVVRGAGSVGRVTTIPVESVAELTTVGTTEAVIHQGAIVRHIDGLQPDSDHEIDDMAFRTLPEPGELLATFATVNDVHFGETVAGVVSGSPEVGPVFSSAPGDPPYPLTMNAGAIAGMVALDPALVIVKGDLTSNGTREEYDAFLAMYEPAFADRLVHVRGNHESYHDLAVADDPVQQVDVPGARLVVLDTSRSQSPNGAVTAAQIDELDTIAAEADRPVIVFGHHHPWNPVSAERDEDYFGINPDDSEALVAVVARRPSIIGYFAGHTHRNRVRHFPSTGGVPWVEVASVKEYPGGWAEYRVHEDGVLQIFHRVSTPEALAWTEQTRQMYHGLFATYAFGELSDRCFAFPTRRA